MSDWSGEIEFLTKKLGMRAANAVRSVRSILANDPFEILCYRGFGNNARAHVYGRVVERSGVDPSSDSDSTLRNLLNTYRRAESDPLPRAAVTVKYHLNAVSMTADNEGFFGGWIERTDVDSHDEWSDYAVALGSNDKLEVSGSGEILIPPSTASFGVISDIDDTVIQSRVSNFLQAARTVMLGNARTRLPFPGVAAFYRALRAGSSGGQQNPVFYVSSSPWNIYDVIAEFMVLQNIPKGPLLLRDWDVSLGAWSSSRHFDHKGVAIRNIMQLYPGLPFILIGDTSQHDPEIYRQIVSEFPNRVNAIYIRDVTRNAERSASVRRLAEEIVAAKSALVLSDDTLGAARHALEHGWIEPGALPEIGEDKRADEGTAGSKVASPEGGKPGTSDPAIVVDPGA